MPYELLVGIARDRLVQFSFVAPLWYSNLYAAAAQVRQPVYATSVGRWRQYERELAPLIERLRAKGFNITHADLGGGLGVAYRPEQQTPSIPDFVRLLKSRVEGRNLRVMVEPGRSIVAAAGALVTKVLYRKTSGDKEFVIVDAHTRAETIRADARNLAFAQGLDLIEDEELVVVLSHGGYVKAVSTDLPDRSVALTWSGERPARAAFCSRVAGASTRA